MKKKLKVMTDEEVDKFAKRLKSLADKEVEPPKESVPENELIDLAAENVAIVLKKRKNTWKQ